jgi:hypothetical protein
MLQTKTALMKRTLLYYLILLFLFTSCHSIRQSQHEEISQTDSQVILCTFHLSKSPEGYYIELTDLKKVDGKLKYTKSNPRLWLENDFYCMVINRFNQVTDSIRIEQPLNPRYEFPDENGIIGVKNVELQETDVLVRFPNREKLQSLQLGIVDQLKKFRQISSINISKKL